MDGLPQAASEAKLVQDASKHVAGLLRKESVTLALAALAVAILQLLGQHLSKSLAAVQTYGADQKSFLSFSSFTSLCTAITTTLAAAACTLAQSKEFVPAAPIYCYVIIAVSGAVASAFESKLGKLSIPVGLAWQCFIVIFVMVWQMAILRRKYARMSWVVSSIFIIGCVASVLPWGTLEHGNETRWYHSLAGVPLALLYLGIQGLNQTFQEKLFREFGTTVLDQVLFISLINSSINITGFLLERHVLDALNFFFAHPLSLLSVVLLSIVGACMTFLMSYMLQLCGALICVMIHQTVVNRISPGVRMSGGVSKVLELLGSLVMLTATLVTMFQLSHHHTHPSGDLLDGKEMSLDDLDNVEFDEEDVMLHSIVGVVHHGG